MRTFSQPGEKPCMRGSEIHSSVKTEVTEGEKMLHFSLFYLLQF